MTTFLTIFGLFFCMRLCTLFYSIKNERKLRSEGAVEYGATNSLMMTILHVLFYAGSLAECLLKGSQLDAISYVGISMFLFSYLVLIYVIYQIRDVWTVKLFIAREHKVNTSFLFKHVRHPNYFLNIVPELAGIGLFCKAWTTMVVILPFYCVTMVLRIIQEERAMKDLAR